MPFSSYDTTEATKATERDFTNVDKAWPIILADNFCERLVGCKSCFKDWLQLF